MPLFAETRQNTARTTQRYHEGRHNAGLATEKERWEGEEHDDFGEDVEKISLSTLTTASDSERRRGMLEEVGFITYTFC